jgi:hypothetical protein
VAKIQTNPGSPSSNATKHTHPTGKQLSGVLELRKQFSGTSDDLAAEMLDSCHLEHVDALQKVNSVGQTATRRCLFSRMDSAKSKCKCLTPL